MIDEDAPCPHTLIYGATARSCSQCRGVVPRVVTAEDGVIRIDGRRVRASEPKAWSPGVEAAKRRAIARRKLRAA